MAHMRLCRCGKKIEFEKKYCDKCASKTKKEKNSRNKHYDKYFRDKESYAIYHNPIWIKLTEQCKHKFKGLDIYQLYKYDEIIYGTLSHHIEPVKDNNDRVYDITNLIYLSDASHAEIHKEYDKSDESKRNMQRYLFSLINRYEKEYKE
ncbi:endonuclease [Tepidibacter mesophilus]|uniref:endonuclease n=1 Tax=Tepidibacter mesophilus TaxID=655607 RepID=UPI000C06B844|nr:endonuclease [Tepidibacter mesophilus]